jgi:hypothetical protein
MKKFKLITKFFSILLIMFLVACTKSNDTPNIVANNKDIANEMATTESFVSLNDAITKFDPFYLQVMYKDVRTIDEIQKQGSSLITEINKNPNNLATQKALAEFYHFDSFSDLQKASQLISSSAEKFRSKYSTLNQLQKVDQNKIISNARRLFINNKMELLEKASQKRAKGLWNDMVDGILIDWEYWRLVQNEEFGNEDGGGSAECTDACCYEYKACLTKAASAYRLNFLGLTAAIGGTGVGLGGFAGTSVLPVLGTAAGMIGGGIIGGVTGFIQSVNIYLLDQQACVYSYKACIIRKNEN